MAAQVSMLVVWLRCLYHGRTRDWPAVVNETPLKLSGFPRRVSHELIQSVFGFSRNAAGTE